MRTVSVLLVSAFVLAVAGGALAGEKTYGKGVTGTETVPVSALLADPDAYIGKTLRVKGMAVGVCAHRGCWINVAGDKEGEVVRVQVPDGVIVFPPEIVGDEVIAEGVWTANELTLEQTKEVCAAEARKKGDANYDPDSVTTCKTLYALAGTGAVATTK